MVSRKCRFKVSPFPNKIRLGSHHLISETGSWARPKMLYSERKCIYCSVLGDFFFSLWPEYINRGIFVQTTHYVVMNITYHTYYLVFTFLSKFVKIACIAWSRIHFVLLNSVEILASYFIFITS